MNDEEARRLSTALDNNTSAICVLVEAIGYYSENEKRKSRGEALAYGEEAFINLIATHNLQGF